MPINNASTPAIGDKIDIWTREHRTGDEPTVSSTTGMDRSITAPTLAPSFTLTLDLTCSLAIALTVLTISLVALLTLAQVAV